MLDWSSVFIVAARGGSQRLPNKNLTLLGGKPLLSYTADAVRESMLPYPVVLTTDSEEIMSCGQSLNWEVPFRRPPELATSSIPAVEAVIHAVDWIRKAHIEPKFIMLLQPTSPFRSGATIRQAFDLLANCEEANSVLSVFNNKKTSDSERTHNRPTALDSASGNSKNTDAFVPNGAIYLVRTSALLETRDLSAPSTILLPMSAEESIDIDTKDDLCKAEHIIAQASFSLE